MKLAAIAALALLISASVQAQESAPLTIVAAENFYGDVAQQLAGAHAKVTSILSNPDEDPHLFEASPSIARALAAARVAVYNGVDYDPWMAKLLGASTVPNRQVIVVADLTHTATGSNPASVVRPGDHARLRAGPLGRPRRRRPGA
ncbi:MAG: zinc ABC transporter substrate-binding protein [Acetobacteraceae bacterium]